MIGAIQEFWHGRTPRERAMLAVMAAALAVFAIWLLIVRPLTGWAEASAQRRQQAETALAQVRALPPAPERHDVAGLEPTLRTAAQAQGLEPTLAMSEDGGLGFRLSGVAAGPALRWLAAVKTASGAEPRRLSITSEGETVSLEGAY